jgi:hypothetical protein
VEQSREGRQADFPDAALDARDFADGEAALASYVHLRQATVEASAPQVLTEADNKRHVTHDTTLEREMLRIAWMSQGRLLTFGVER